MAKRNVTADQGEHGRGGRYYDKKDVAAVLAELFKHPNPTDPITVAELADITLVDGRAVRELVRDFDGKYYDVGPTPKGYWLVDSWEDAERETQSLESQIREMQERVDARRAWADANLPKRQPGLI